MVYFYANMLYDISIKSNHGGGDHVARYEQLDSLAAQNGGVLRTGDVVAAGISKTTLKKFVAERQYERIAHGVYLSPDAWKDSLYIIGLRCPQGFFSHETALFLHDLTDREPMQYTLTVKTGYNPSGLTADGMKVYTVKKELYGLGASSAETSFGHTVAVYDMERTICDIVRSRRNIDAQTFQSALKQYARKRDKNLPLLMDYAQKFHVDKILRQYLEVLL